MSRALPTTLPRQLPPNIARHLTEVTGCEQDAQRVWGRLRNSLLQKTQRRGNPLFSDDEVRQIRREYDYGMQLREKWLQLCSSAIAEKFELTRNQIRSIEMDCKPKGVSDEDINLIKDLLADRDERRHQYEKHSSAVLAKKYGVHKTTIKSIGARWTYAEVDD